MTDNIFRQQSKLDWVLYTVTCSEYAAIFCFPESKVPLLHVHRFAPFWFSMNSYQTFWWTVIGAGLQVDSSVVLCYCFSCCIFLIQQPDLGSALNQMWKNSMAAVLSYFRIWMWCPLSGLYAQFAEWSHGKKAQRWPNHQRHWLEVNNTVRFMKWAAFLSCSYVGDAIDLFVK